MKVGLKDVPSGIEILHRCEHCIVWSDDESVDYSVVEYPGGREFYIQRIGGSDVYEVRFDILHRRWVFAKK